MVIFVKIIIIQLINAISTYFFVLEHGRETHKLRKALLFLFGFSIVEVLGITIGHLTENALRDPFIGYVLSIMLQLTIGAITLSSSRYRIIKKKAEKRQRHVKKISRVHINKDGQLKKEREFNS